MMIRPLLFCCLCGVACARDQAVKPAAVRRAAGDAHAVAPAVDTADPPIPDSILRRVAAFGDSLAHDGTGARAATWLWMLGRLTQTSLGSVPGTGHYGAYAKAHPEQYSYSEPDAEFVYNGFHFAELVRRFPQDTLADRAGYALTNLGIVGECEGDVACNIGRELFPLRTFLARFPSSPLARNAILRVNIAFDSTLAYSPGPRDAWEVDSTAIRAEIAGYDSTAQTLPPALRALATPTIERLRERWKVPP